MKKYFFLNRQNQENILERFLCKDIRLLLIFEWQRFSFRSAKIWFGKILQKFVSRKAFFQKSEKYWWQLIYFQNFIFWGVFSHECVLFWCPLKPGHLNSSITINIWLLNMLTLNIDMLNISYEELPIFYYRDALG